MIRVLPLLLLAGCAFLAPKVPKESPPLLDLEEPLELYEEPADEPERIGLPKGSFTGVYVTESARNLEDLGSEPEGVLIDRVVENSPGQFAALEKGDLIVEANGEPVQYASEWRKLELETEPGTRIELIYDRAGAEREATLVAVERVYPADRRKAERFREEDRVGVVVRTATEVEARNAGLGPGAGAVVVGLARTSPWRRAGLLYGDLIVDAGGQAIAHPNLLLKAVRDAPAKGRIKLKLVRGGETLEIDAPVSRRAQEQQITQIPLLYYFERDRDQTSFWVFLGIYKRVKTAAATDTRVLWFFKFRSGDSDRLEEVKE
ncbi:MAG: PDZ domain-containing protein [Planctomycetota bacterium]